MTRDDRVAYWTAQQERYRHLFTDVDPEIGDSLTRYIVDQVLPGHFLTAVLQNNLKESFARADEENARNMSAIVKLLYNAIPSDAWGSPEKVQEWVRQDAEPAKGNDNAT